jgi:TRAP-type transport system periplasmic protein
MKFTRSFVGGTTAALMFVLASAVQAQPVSLRIAGAFGGEHTSSKAMEIFKTELARRSQGSVDVEISPDMKLGGAKDLIDSVRADTIFATWVGVAFVSGSFRRSRR